MTVFNGDDAPLAPAARAKQVRHVDRDVGITTIYVCSSCRDEDGSDERPRPGELFANRIAAANKNDRLEVVQVECLGNCKRRLSAAFARAGGWTYVFGDLAAGNANDLIEGALLYSESTNGLIPWRGRPDCLKRGLVARIPPSPFNKASS